jgi:hypothetical protein
MPKSDARSFEWRHAWIERAWTRDTSAVERWFSLVTTVDLGESSVELLRRFVGWDRSAPPGWLVSSSADRVSIVCEEIDSAHVVAFLNAAVRGEDGARCAEVRRSQPPTLDWLGQMSSETWALQVPLVMYEAWAGAQAYERGRSAWEQLTAAERAATLLGSACQGYLGSAVVLIPQAPAAFFVGVHNLVLRREARRLRELTLVSEVVDGAVVISRSACRLDTQPFRQLSAEENLHHVTVYFREPTLAQCNAPIGESAPHELGLARLPQDEHGHSGSDWRVSIVGLDGVVDVASVGLMRGLGDGYFTREPWRERAPSLGFSSPARVIHLPPTQGAQGAELLGLAGAPIDVSDPYADTPHLVQLERVLRGGRLLTTPKAAAKLDVDWLRRNVVRVRTAGTVHDRFVVGRKRAFLVGASLNGLGKRHSFLTELDNVMRAEVSRVFEELWSEASAWPGAAEDDSGAR